MTEAFQPPDVIAGHALRLEVIEEVSAQVGIVRSCFQHVITKIEWPTAIRARFLPRRPAKRRYCEAR